jgi:tRNA threonylcarbamoyladenosine biosynthesis protein TsaE
MSEIVDFDEMKAVAEGFISGLSKNVSTATVVGLKGDLGSGKTTFVKHVATLLGVEGVVTSPTFVIEKIYKLPSRIPKQTFNHLIHIDAYRLSNKAELEVLGWDEIFKNTYNLIFIEWPEQVKGLVPDNAPIIKFSFVDDKTRKIDF